MYAGTPRLATRAPKPGRHDATLPRTAKRMLICRPSLCAGRCPTRFVLSPAGGLTYSQFVRHLSMAK